MLSLIGIYAGAVLTLVVAMYHTQLYKKLNWSEEFGKVDTVNAQIF